MSDNNSSMSDTISTLYGYVSNIVGSMGDSVRDFVLNVASEPEVLETHLVAITSIAKVLEVGVG